MTILESWLVLMMEPPSFSYSRVGPHDMGTSKSGGHGTEYDESAFNRGEPTLTQAPNANQLFRFGDERIGGWKDFYELTI